MKVTIVDNNKKISKFNIDLTKADCSIHIGKKEAHITYASNKGEIDIHIDGESELSILKNTLKVA
jgi:hypothetical protein